MLKTRVRTGRAFANAAAREAFIDRFEEAGAKACALGRRYVLAPDETMKTADGRMLREGDEVRVEDFAFIQESRDGTQRDVPPWRQLENAVFAGRVIDSQFHEPQPTPPRAA